MNVDYLIQAIKIVVSGQLKENHDDSLIEKLITLVERNIDDDIFTRKDEVKILTVLTDHLDIDQPEPTCFRLMALILADLYISYSSSVEEEMLDSAFVAFVTASRIISSSSDLSLQSSFIRSYAYICRKNQSILDRNHIRSGDLNFLPAKIAELMRNSSSFYVRSEAESVLIELLLNNQGNVENDSSSNLRIELGKIVDVPSKGNLEFMKHLSSKTSMIRSLIRMEIRDRMFDHFKNLVNESDFDEPLIMACLEVLGSLIPKPAVVDHVISTLVKLNRLKALVVFTSTLMKTDRDHLNKWMQFSLYTLVCRSDLRFEVSSQILISVRERNFIEKLCNDSIILSVLTRIPIVLANIDERESLLREALQILLTEELKKKKGGSRKIVSEAISALGKMLEEGISSGREIINTICDLIPLSSGYHRIGLLTICRNFYSKTLSREVVGIDKICDILCDIFRDNLHQDDCSQKRHELYGDRDPQSEVLESSVQVLGVISCSPSISTKLELIKLFHSLFIKHSDDGSFIISSVPVLFSVNFELSAEMLKEIFGWEKNVDIIKILCSYLQTEDSSLLQMKVIETLKDESHFERVSFLQTFRMDLFFKELIPALCHCVISSVDTETQRSVIELMTTMFQFPNEGLIQVLYSSSVLDLLFYIIENKTETFPRSLRVEVSELIIIIKQVVRDSMLGDGKSVKEVLEKNERPEEYVQGQVSTEEFIIAPVPSSEKVEKIELLFNKSVNQPTMDLIEELSKREPNCESMNGVRGKKFRVCRVIHDLDELVKFYTDTSNRLIQDEDPEEDSLIIDDIVSAQIRPNTASTDCY